MMTQVINPYFVTPPTKLADEKRSDGAQAARYQDQHGLCLRTPTLGRQSTRAGDLAGSGELL